MLIISGISREHNRRSILTQLRQLRVPVRLKVRRSRLELNSMLWGDYWQPCRLFFDSDARLVQRLNRLKKAWLGVLRHPSDRLSQMDYCWRYFGLLHHAIRIAREEPRRPHPLRALRQIAGFETFLLEAVAEAGAAACTVAGRNPLFLLGQLAVDPVIPTPRHVPLLLPAGCAEPYYHYRQVFIGGARAQTLLLSPAVNLPDRSHSFLPIDRFTRLISDRSDPYWKPRARLLVRRILGPLLKARQSDPDAVASPVTLLDLGAGTGHLVAKSWTYLGRASTCPRQDAAFHFVDSNPPAFGRSFGLSRHQQGVTHVEWTTGDYRKLADDDDWLRKCGPFDWAFACRILDNSSNFLIEPVSIGILGPDVIDSDCLPHRCLAPRAQPEGIRRLAVACTRREANGGTILPQFSLRDYFAAVWALQSDSLTGLRDDCWYLPVRRFNPACLITPSGRSLIGQLMKASRAVIIEDVDVEPEHLRQHKSQFGLPGTAAVFCTQDGFRTESNHFVITSPRWADFIRGERLW